MKKGLFLVYGALLVTVFGSVDAQWVQTAVPTNGYIGAIAVTGSNIFVGGFWSSGSVYVSSDDGLNWAPSPDTTIQTKPVDVFAVKDSFLFAGTNGYGVYRSSNLGLDWQPVNNGLPVGAVLGLTVGDSGVFASSLGHGTYLSTNNGATWKGVNSGLTSTNIWTLASFPNGTGGRNVFAGTSNGVFRSTNNGANWQVMDAGLTDSSVWSFAAGTDSNIFAATFGGGVFLSTNGGKNWQAVNNGLTNLIIQPLTVTSNGANIFAGTWGNGVFESTNNGANWHTTFLPDSLQVNALALSSSNIFAGVYTGGGVWRRKLSEILSAEKSGNQIPFRFEVKQNYPNPFNPTTTIKYELPTSSHVTLKIYDLLGQVVRTLTDNTEPAGYKQIEWNAASVASGVYFYRLEAVSVGDPSKTFTSVKAMLLMR